MLQALLEFDTCILANAIETFDIRLRNEGYTRPGLHCLTGECPKILGYAVTCRVRSAEPPMAVHSYYDRTDWWNLIASRPTPRVAVIQDVDLEPGLGSSIGEVHATILNALGCGAVITNGSVRDLPALRRMRFPVLATSVTVSHAYMRMIDFGHPVEILGLRVLPGDLLFADCHGVLSIPLSIVKELPAVAASIVKREQRIIDFCRSADFTIDKLREEVQETQP